MSILRGAITNCSDAFLDSIPFRRRAMEKSIWSMPALTSRALARASSIASRFSLEYCTQKNFQSLRLATPRIIGSRIMSSTRLNLAVGLAALGLTSDEAHRAGAAAGLKLRGVRNII